MLKLMAVVVLSLGISSPFAKADGSHTNENRPTACVCEVCWVNGSCVQKKGEPFTAQTYNSTTQASDEAGKAQDQAPSTSPSTF